MVYVQWDPDRICEKPGDCYGGWMLVERKLHIEMQGLATTRLRSAASPVKIDVSDTNSVLPQS